MKKFNFIADSNDLKNYTIIRAVMNYYGKEREGKTWEAISLNHDSLMKKGYGASYESALRELGYAIRQKTGGYMYRYVYRITNVDQLPGMEKIKLLNEAWDDALFMDKHRNYAIEERRIQRERKKELFTNLRGVKNVKDYIRSHTMYEIELKRFKNKDGDVVFSKRTYKRRQDGTFNWDLIKKNIIRRDIEIRHLEAFKVEKKRTQNLRFDQIQKLGLTGFYTRCKMEKKDPYFDNHMGLKELKTLIKNLEEKGYKNEDTMYIKVPVRKDGKDIKDVVESFRSIGAYM